MEPFSAGAIRISGYIVTHFFIERTEGIKYIDRDKVTYVIVKSEIAVMRGVRTPQRNGFSE